MVGDANESIDLRASNLGGAHRAALRDVRPILRREPGSIWSRVEAARDTLCTELEGLCKQLGFRPLIIRSGPFVQPAWVKLECWVPEKCVPAPARVTYRRSALISIHAREFHEYEIEFSLELDDCGRKKTYSPLQSFDSKRAEELVRFFLLEGPRPKYSELSFRHAAAQFGRRENPVKIVDTDWLRVSGVALLLLGILTLAIRIGIVLLIAGIIASTLARRRKYVVRSSGKPDSEPRFLYRVDSWQAVISGLGITAEELRGRFITILGRPPMSGFRYRVERIWYWGLDGTVEREQIVLALRRSLVFCHIYRYDEELYVGWDGHLNSGSWIEKTLAKGVKRHSGIPMLVNTVEPGRQPLTEYDITDVDCLMEWTHAKLVKLVKDLMDERRVDQEVDFTILRGERQSVTESRASGSPADRQRLKLLRLG